MKTSRRSFIKKSALAATGLSVLAENAGAVSAVSAGVKTGVQPAKDPDAFRISIFSKHLQWLDYREMAKAVRELGFDGVDLTVRPEGHVLPENVERDLPKAVEAIEKEGRKVYMLTTAVYDADDPVSTKILKTASSLGIKHYRMGYGYYGKQRSASESISLVNASLDKLAKLNEKYSISGEYQNHSGDYGSGIYFGGPVWDLLAALKRINSPFLGSQYDIYHATIEGANAWPVVLELLSPYIRSIDVKDFIWMKKDGKWISETVPLGEGAVDLKRYFGLVKKLNISCPVSVHYEYPTGGAENGAKVITLKRDELLSMMSRDLSVLKGMLKEAELV
jgi:sugar phosphate isomerase/epimerase